MKLIEKTFQPHILPNLNLKLNYMRIFMIRPSRLDRLKKKLGWQVKKI
jgi:hypothetical protein